MGRRLGNSSPIVAHNSETASGIIYAGMFDF